MLIEREIAKQIIGKTKQEAFYILESNNIDYRVVSIDGSPLVCTKDFNSKRVNLKITNGHISDAYNG